MRMNPSIPMAGANPNFLQTIGDATRAAGMANAVQDQNALRGLYREQGPGIMAGEQNAMNAFARLDPVQAGQMQQGREKLQMLRAEAARSAETHVAKMDAVTRAREAEELDRSLAMLAAAQTPEEWDRIAAEREMPNEVGNFAGRDMVLAKGLGLKDVLAMQAPPKSKYQMVGNQFVDMNNPQAGAQDVPGLDPGMYAQFTGEEARARGLDPNKTWQVGPDNKVSEVGGNGVTVNNNMGGSESELYKTMDKAQGEMFSTLIEGGMAIPSRMAQIDQLESYLGDVSTPEGVEAGLKALAGKWGIKTEGLSTLQAANALISRMVPQQRPPGSGPMSDADLDLFKQSLPRLLNTRDGNLMILRTLRGIAKYEAAQADIAAAVANRELSPADARRALSELENPLEVFRGSGETTIGGGIDPETQALIDQYAK